VAQPFDPSQMKAIERPPHRPRRISGSTPANDGKVIRIPIPKLTE